MKTSRHLVPLLALSALAALSGCATNPTCGADQRNFDEVTLCPGASRSCAVVPCTVHYQMPEGSGDYRVFGNGIPIGAYPAGARANLGAFWESYYFDLQGVDVPRAYVFIGDTP